MSDILPAISRAAAGVQTFLNGNSKAILVPNFTDNPTVANEAAGGWVFDIPTGESADFESDVTDHYTESGSFINDQIVNKPIRVTLTGLVGELVYRRPSGARGVVRQIAGRLSQVAAYGGNWTPSFVSKIQGIVGKAQTAAALADNYIRQAQNAAGAVTSALGQSASLQKKAYDQIAYLWRQKTIFTVTTPWARHSAMVITALGFRQDESSNDFSTISITLKEFRFAQTKLSIFKGGDTDITAIQSSDGQSQGTAGTSNKTFLKSVGDGKPDFGALPGGNIFNPGAGQ